MYFIHGFAAINERNEMMKTTGTLLGWTLALTCASAMAVERPPDGARRPTQGISSPRADNTDINDRDKDGATKTPQTQSNNTQNRELLAAVRRAIVNDKSLSTMAHNVKILVERGTVTLRGPVSNEAEKVKIGSHAKQVKGITKTDNQLDVKASVSTQ